MTLQAAGVVAPRQSNVAAGPVPRFTLKLIPVSVYLVDFYC